MLGPELMIVLAAIAFAVVRQGAYDGHAFALVEGLVALSVVVGLTLDRPTAATWKHPIFLSAAAIGISTMISAVAHGEVRAASPTFGILACGAVIGLLVARAQAAARDVFLTAVLGVAGALAITGWWGVADHHYPWGLVDGGLWRAASTLTYANATAAFLAPTALVSLARLVTVGPSRHRRPALPWTALSVVLLAATGATLSRAGLLALAVGWAILAATCGVKVTARASLGPAAGGVVALAGLIPSMPATTAAGAAAHPALAILALLAGLGLAVGLIPTPSVARQAHARRSLTEIAVVGVLALAGLVVLSPGNGLGAIRTSRVSAASPDRTHEWTATWTLARDHALVGVGPGPFAASWSAPGGTTMTAEYTHNEYLQLAAQQGVAGVVAAGAALLLFGSALVRRRARLGRDLAPRAAWAAPVAGLAALAVHSGFDFIWHIPVLVLLGAVLAGTALPIVSSRQGAHP